MAPLVASVAASVAVGMGVSLAKLARQRRSKRARRLGLVAGEGLSSGLQRMALGQLDLALEILGSGESAPNEKAVHETRKALKRLRALLRLLQSELDAGAYRRESDALRDAGRKLAGARDAEVMLATLDELIERHPRKLTGRGGVIRLRAALLAERERARGQTLGDPAARAQVLAELHACRVRVAAWRLPERGELRLVEAGLLRLYRQGERRRRRAAHAKQGDVLRMHEWRKRVKDLRYVTEMLKPDEDPAKRDAPESKRARRRHRHARKHAKWLAQMARRADQLGELLGEDHDLAVLGTRIEQDTEQGGRAGVRLGKGTRRGALEAGGEAAAQAAQAGAGRGQASVCTQPREAGAPRA